MRIQLIAAAAALVATPASATMTAADFNLFVLRDANLQGSDTEGRVAVGRDANFLPYDPGQKVSGGTNLVVGRNLQFSNDTFRSSMVVGGNATLSGVAVSGNITANGNVNVSNMQVNGNINAGGSVTQSGTGVSGTVSQNQAAVTLPVDFAAEAARLTKLSSIYADYSNVKYLPSYATTGTVSKVNYGQHNTQMTLTGSGSGVNVFNISGADFADTSTFNVILNAGGVALINISGTNELWHDAGMTVNGNSGDGAGANVLFNFYQATTLNFSGASPLGSVLAPLASYTPTGSAHIAGQVIVNDFNGTNSAATQINNIALRDFAVGKNLLTAAVPESSTWTMLIVGFGAIGGTMRMRRRRLAAA